jgi:hypothetical protein
LFSYDPEPEHEQEPPELPSLPRAAPKGATYAIYWNESTVKLWILPLENSKSGSLPLGQSINLSDLSKMSHGEINGSMDFPWLQRWPDLTQKMNLVSTESLESLLSRSQID